MFNPGDTVTIPKDVLILDGPGGEYADQAKRIETKRATTAALTGVNDWSHKWYMFISEENQQKITKLVGGYYVNQFKDSWCWGRPRVTSPEMQQLIEQIKAETDAIFGDYKFVSWANDRKHCVAAHVEAAQPKVKVAKEAKITNRRLMVPGSVWRFTKEVEIDIWVANPMIEQLEREKRSYYVDQNSQHQRGGTMIVVLGGGRPQTQAELDAMARIQKQIDNTPNKIKIKAAVVPEGVRVRIADKLAAGWKSHRDKETNGLLAPMEVLEGTIKVADNLLKKNDRYANSLYYANGISLPYNQIEAAMVPESVPENIVWALRDTKSRNFFGGWETERENGYNRQNNTPKMSETFSGSKKYKNLAALKASIMDFTGYHSGIEDEGYKADWVGGDKKIDLPPTWEAVAIDKTTNAEKETSDVQSWYGNLMRLRVLTVRFGSAVRTVYKKIEGKPEYTAIVVFKTPERYEDLDENTRALIAEAIDTVVDGRTPNAKNDGAQAFALKNEDDAMLVRLSYQGKAECIAVNVNDLSEIVPPEKATA